MAGDVADQMEKAMKEDAYSDGAFLPEMRMTRKTCVSNRLKTANWPQWGHQMS